MLEEQFVEVVEKNGFVCLDEETNELAYGINFEDCLIDVVYIRDEKIVKVYENDELLNKEKNKIIKTLSTLKRYLKTAHEKHG